MKVDMKTEVEMVQPNALRTLSAASADEVRACIRLLLDPEVQLLTLTGAPGTGKTWLASAVAESLARTLPHGAVVAELAELENWVVFLAAVAEALDLPDSERSLWSIKESLQAYLRDKTMLLVLDTFEHIMPAAPSVRFLLDMCPQLTVLVTSRQPLGLEEERTLTVSPLPLPELDQPETLIYNEGVALFARYADVAPDVLSSGTTAQEIAQLCHRLEGVPLAIIAAAALGSGVPLHVRMFVPLWVVNTTGMAVSAGLVPLFSDSADAVMEGLFDGSARWGLRSGLRVEGGRGAGQVRARG